MMHWGFPGYGFGGGFGLIGFIFMLVFWGFIIWFIAALVRNSSEWRGARHDGEKGDKTYLEILKERYAKGEIDKKEFEQMKKDLV